MTEAYKIYQCTNCRARRTSSKAVPKLCSHCDSTEFRLVGEGVRRTNRPSDTSPVLGKDAIRSGK